MSSTEYMVGFLAMAILIPGIVHGGITWAYFRSKQEMSLRPAGEVAEPHRPHSEGTHGTVRMTAGTPSAINDDGRVPDKQIWRWQDDGGVVGSPS